MTCKHFIPRAWLWQRGCGSERFVQECSQGRTAEKVEGRAEVCSHCPEGRYQTQPGQTVCSACPKACSEMQIKAPCKCSHASVD
eukprot:5006862-Amphidinium_carterae.2